MDERVLDIQNIARIGLMFLDGDLLEKVVIDPANVNGDSINYKADYFNALKSALIKIERMNPDHRLLGVLWTKHPHNKYVAIPAIAGSSLPYQGWEASRMSDAMLNAMLKGIASNVTHTDGRVISYFPVKNSNNNIVGLLELADTKNVDSLYSIFDW